MAIPEADIKLLWGRAAGKCSNPECGHDLTALLNGGSGYNIGEMAHVIARKSSGPRGVPRGGTDAYQNLILLCPTCHRKIDKAPAGQFPEEMLLGWKKQHEARVAALGKQKVFKSKEELWSAVRKLLQENHNLWKGFGPHSDVATKNPASNLCRIWVLRKLDTIVPNNARMIRFIESNQGYLSSDEWGAFLKFKGHATAFEAHQYERIEEYPTFPEEFGRMFEE